MRRFAHDSDRPDATIADAVRPPGQRLVEAQLLSLQGAAGNRAVTAQLMQDPARVVPVQRACCSSCADGGSCESDAAPAPDAGEAMASISEGAHSHDGDDAA